MRKGFDKFIKKEQLSYTILHKRIKKVLKNKKKFGLSRELIMSKN